MLPMLLHKDRVSFVRCCMCTSSCIYLFPALCTVRMFPKYPYDKHCPSECPHPRLLAHRVLVGLAKSSQGVDADVFCFAGPLISCTCNTWTNGGGAVIRQISVYKTRLQLDLACRLQVAGPCFGHQTTGSLVKAQQRGCGSRPVDGLASSGLSVCSLGTRAHTEVGSQRSGVHMLTGGSTSRETHSFKCSHNDEVP